MIKEYKIPSPGESISEVELASWLVEDGSYVDKNDEVAEVESDKATLMLVAEESGKISIKLQAGETVKVGTVAFTIDTEAEAPEQKEGDKQEAGKKRNEEEEQADEKDTTQDQHNEEETKQPKVTPLAAKIMDENHLNVDDIIQGLRRIGKSEVEAVMNAAKSGKPTSPSQASGTALFSRDQERNKMSMLRRRLSERLVSVKNETAMLTTFNEVDMSAVMNLRKQMQNRFVEKHGFKLGFMGFFTKAVSIAAQLYPAVNSQIDGEEIISPSYVDVGIAVQTPKGLMVPNLRNVESKSIASIEKEIKDLAQKARDKKISIEDLSGGTISITNGGVFGSLLSTPILNPPQSAILGMHNIVDRPVAVDGQVVIRPMMYLALSYDHRIIDGKDSVGFLKTVKELIETPENMLFNGINPLHALLDL
ncbi:2-oxoglutarate dehydrogenase complex dihydrolipoyllysine-residue succinyltransferase [Roseimarinus sediminis]|uniref:2-oxoglutarate dehydrogenase complex dihydrolipoyllysine-residue succinyltransferase n=1 Tax=Roseimarinus sediminis TaxID=1610899 RepID=UPI003D1EB2C9